MYVYELCTLCAHEETIYYFLICNSATKHQIYTALQKLVHFRKLVLQFLFRNTEKTYLIQLTWKLFILNLFYKLHKFRLTLTVYSILKIFCFIY